MLDAQRTKLTGTPKTARSAAEGASGLSEMLGVGLAKETRILIFLDECEKLFKARYLGTRFIAVPFQICPLPKDLPDALSLDIRGLRNRAFHLVGWFSPYGTNLEYFNTLTLNAEAKVKLVANVLWRSALFDKLRNYFLDLLRFEFA
jgi:hypothetical protein